MRSDLRDELLRRRDRDQAVRAKLVARYGVAPVTDGLDPGLLRDLERVDRENTAWLKTIVREQGWPGISLVGQDGADCAWLLAQHADRDPAFQAECLALLERAVGAGDASPGHLAYLTDRVLLKERGMQRYGTQFRVGPGGPEPEALEDPERVDELCAAMGLQPLEDYRKGFVRGPSL